MADTTTNVSDLEASVSQIALSIETLQSKIADIQTLLQTYHPSSSTSTDTDETDLQETIASQQQAIETMQEQLDTIQQTIQKNHPQQEEQQEQTQPRVNFDAVFAKHDPSTNPYQSGDVFYASDANDIWYGEQYLNDLILQSKDTQADLLSKITANADSITSAQKTLQENIDTVSAQRLSFYSTISAMPANNNLNDTYKETTVDSNTGNNVILNTAFSYNNILNTSFLADLKSNGLGQPLESGLYIYNQDTVGKPDDTQDGIVSIYVFNESDEQTTMLITDDQSDSYQTDTTNVTTTVYTRDLFEVAYPIDSTSIYYRSKRSTNSWSNWAPLNKNYDFNSVELSSEQTVYTLKPDTPCIIKSVNKSNRVRINLDENYPYAQYECIIEINGQFSSSTEFDAPWIVFDDGIKLPSQVSVTRASTDTNTQYYINIFKALFDTTTTYYIKILGGYMINMPKQLGKAKAFNLLDNTDVSLIKNYFISYDNSYCYPFIMRGWTNNVTIGTNKISLRCYSPGDQPNSIYQFTSDSVMTKPMDLSGYSMVRIKYGVPASSKAQLLRFLVFAVDGSNGVCSGNLTGISTNLRRSLYTVSNKQPKEVSGTAVLGSNRQYIQINEAVNKGSYVTKNIDLTSLCAGLPSSSNVCLCFCGLAPWWNKKTVFEITEISFLGNDIDPISSTTT